jgi:hypothetical protein
MKPSNTDEKREKAGDEAREHSEYAEEGRNTGEPRPREEGDYCDPVKDLTGRGNASKGPWKEQGGAGEGDNYGARDKRPDPEKAR